MDEKVIFFPQGIPGFEALKKYIMVEDEGSGLYELQSLEETHISFVILDPHKISMSYSPCIKEEYFEMIGGGDTKDFMLCVIARLGQKLEDATINLRAPILIQVEKRMGVQVILEDDTYHNKEKLIDYINKKG